MTGLLADFEAERAVLGALITGLPVDAWDVPSPAKGWTLRDCISHLSDLDDRATLIARGIEPESTAGEGVLSRAQLDARSFTPAAMLQWYSDSGRKLVAAMQGMQGDERLMWAGRPMGARSFLTARVMEHWSHGLDVFDAACVQPVDTDRLRHVAHLGFATREFSYRARGLEPPTTPLHLVLTAPSSAIWTWGPLDAPDRITGYAGDFCRVVTQRIHVADTALQAEGVEAARFLQIAQAFAGPLGEGRPPKGTDS